MLFMHGYLYPVLASIKYPTDFDDGISYSLKLFIFFKSVYSVIERSRVY